MTRGAPAAAAALVAVLALAGCAAPSTGGATDGDGAATSGPAAGGDGTGGVDPNTQIPATFPTDLPVIEGEVLQSADLGTGWVVLIGVDDANAAFAEATDALSGAGLTEDVRTSSETEGFAQYTGPLYTVQLSSNVDYPDYGPAVSYTVVKNGE